MVAQKSEIAQIVDLAYQETKGEGARRLKVHTSHYYSGLSRNAIQKKLNVMKKPQKLRPFFENNPTELEEELNSLAIERDVLRKKALNASNNASRKMVKRELKRQPPFLY